MSVYHQKLHNLCDYFVSISKLFPQMYVKYYNQIEGKDIYFAWNI